MNIQLEPLKRLVSDVFKRVDCPQDEADRIAHYLSRANLTGHDSHGVIRVLPYSKLVQSGRTASDQPIKITKDAGALVTVDGQEGLGQVVVKKAIDLGIGMDRAGVVDDHVGTRCRPDHEAQHHQPDEVHQRAHGLDGLHALHRVVGGGTALAEVVDIDPEGPDEWPQCP